MGALSKLTMSVWSMCLQKGFMALAEGSDPAYEPRHIAIHAQQCFIVKARFKKL